MALSAGPLAKMDQAANLSLQIGLMVVIVISGSAGLYHGWRLIRPSR